MIAASLRPQDSSQQIREMETLFERQREAFRQDPMFSAEQRIRGLRQLRQVLSGQRQALITAISTDFGNRAATETLLAELMPSLRGIDYATRRIRRWMKPSWRRVGLPFLPASAKVIYQPLGVTGIIVPWNYPLFLTIGPLTSALAAGNRVMIKMSESVPATARLIKELIGSVFPEDQVAVVLGEAEVGQAFSRLPFDHLLFTGATAIGRQVMQAAADNLTPVTLELGGKSPAIVSMDIPLNDAAERIAFGKMLNAGQTCVAPDYVMVPKLRMDAFIDAYRAAIQRFYRHMENNPDYTCIINPRHRQRLQDYLDDALSKGAQVIPLFPSGTDERRMSATLVLDVSDEMRIMQEEIFGPLLPIVPYELLEDALHYINQRPRPLALYYFGYNPYEQQYVLDNTHSGGVSLNDTLSHVAQDDLPFGGVGASGMGHYHGHEGFLTFSKAKSVFIKRRFNTARLMYPPYGRTIQKLICRLFVR